MNVVDVVLPVSVYEHVQGTCVIVGGAVLSGIFLYADFCSGIIWGLQRKGNRWQSTQIINATAAISSIGTDETGNVYATGYASGTIYRIVPIMKDESVEREAAVPMPFEASCSGQTIYLQ